MTTLIAAEGESDCWTLWYHGYNAIGIPGAAATEKLEIRHIQPFDRVIVIQEPDGGGETFAAGVTARLREVGYRGEVLAAKMGGSGFKDPSEIHCAGPEKFKERFEAILAQAKSWVAPELPTIYPRTADLASITTTALEALKSRNNPPSWFIYEATHEPVTISLNGRAVIKNIAVDEFRLILASAAKWMNRTAKGDEPVHPSKDIAATIRSQLSAILPPLRGITYVRVRKFSGGFVGPGYDPETRLWCAAVDDAEIEMSFEEARDLIDEMLCDFQFVSPADKAHAVSLFLLPFLRESIRGSIPIYAVESPRAGTGKGLLVWSLLDPSASYHMAPEVRKEETEKYLTAAVLSGAPAFLFDNINDSVTSATLASLATSPNPTIRPLGTSTMVTLSRLPIFVLTANNPTFSEENARRVARIRIDSNTQDPSLLPTSAFKHRQDVWVRANRARLQAAARAIIQHWDASGRPRLETDIGWGSFEEWFEIMGGITESCGWPGLGETRMGEVSIDERERRWLDLVSAWADTYPHHSIRVRDLVALADQIDDFWGEREVKSKSAVLGRMLNNRRDQVFGKWKVTFKNRTNNIPYWQLIDLGNPADISLIKK